MTNSKTECSTNEKTDPADFQTAIAATGFGKYNIVLLLICIPAAFTTQCESSLMSFIIPAAGCDLNLSLSQKGLLNSMPMIGMLTTGFLWGAIVDTLGRKRVLVVAFTVECCFVLVKSLSQEFYALSAMSLLGGSITGGIYVAVTTYLLEFHSTEHRGKIQIMFGMMYCASNIIVPLLSSAFLPLQVHFRIFSLDIYAWNLLILASSVASILCVINFYFLPESPKFLMSIGNNEEALEVFKKVYSYNSGKSPESYPIKYLIEEISDKKESAANKKSWTEYFSTGGKQLAPLFGKQYGLKLLVIALAQSMFQMTLVSVRIYLPQIYQGIHEYQVANNESFPNICKVFDILRTSKLGEEKYVCSVNLENNFSVYSNYMINASVTLLGYAVTGSLINIFGKKRLLVTLGITASIAVSCLYFSNNIATVLTLSSLFLTAAGLCFELCVTIVVVLFPTTLRAMAFSLCLLSGRSLTVTGNMIFPMLVEAGCAPPFVTYGSIILLAVVLVYLLPNTDKVDMK